MLTFHFDKEKLEQELVNEEQFYRLHLPVLFAIVTALMVSYILWSSPGTFPKGDIITMEDGSTLRSVALELEEQHVIRSYFWLEIFARLMGGARSVKAGDYLFEERLPAFTIAYRITQGKFGLRPIAIRIPEGSTRSEMATIFSERLPKFDPNRFMILTSGEEGYLFPDTYNFLPNAKEEEVAAVLRDTFEEKILSIAEEIDAFGKPLEDVITMASILEKEAHRFETRRMISGVLWKRIEIGMPLQVDAAFLYINGKNTFSLTLEDLKVDSPYNTYRYSGLPVGPIANPSLSAIRAAVLPKASPYLFYLADHNGVTHYAETYEIHQANRSLYLE